MSALIEHALDNPEKLGLILSYIQGKDVPINEDLKEILRRLEFAYDNLMNYRVEKTVESVLKRKYGYSTTQARQDLNYAKRIYNYAHADTKNFDYFFTQQMLLSLYNRALDEGNLSVAEKVLATYSRNQMKVRDEASENNNPKGIVLLVVKPDPTLLGRPIPTAKQLEQKMKEWLKPKIGEGTMDYTPFEEIIKSGSDGNRSSEQVL